MTARALITGGSQGIGLAIARALASASYDVTVLSRRPPPDVDLAHLACDLSAGEGVEETIAEYVESGDEAVEVLIHSAVSYGSTGRHPFLDTTLAEWNATLDVNARGLMLALRAVLPGMLRRDRGLVLEVSSVIATTPGPGRIPYAASKAAAHAVMTGLAEELRETNIRSLQVLPEIQVDTPGIRSRRPADFEPDNGYCSPEVFAAPVLWLLDGHARRYHGCALRIDASGTLRDSEGEPLT